MQEQSTLVSTIQPHARVSRSSKAMQVLTISPYRRSLPEAARRLCLRQSIMTILRSSVLSEAADLSAFFRHRSRLEFDASVVN